MRFVRSSFAALAVLLLASSAHATPVAHPIVASLSNLSANVTATANISLATNLGTQNGTANISGTLSSSPNGSITIDWGNPNWNSQVTAGPGDVVINAPNPGTANGNASINLFGFINTNWTLTVPVDFIKLELASNFASPTAPLDPGAAGLGPWLTGDIVDLALSAQLDFNAVGPFGVNIGTSNVPIGPTVVAAIPLAAQLARIGGMPGTGSRVEVPLPGGLSLSLGAQPPSTVNTPGCEVSVLFGCNLNVTSVTVTLTSLNFTNVSGLIIAEQVGTIVPEPATLGLVGGGLAGLTVAARRRRRQD
jgi:hypothetical protein